jgi:CheY-like chemotaxis protein
LLDRGFETQEGRFMSELQTATVENISSVAATASVSLPLALIADANSVSRARRSRQLEKLGYRVAIARTSFETIVKASCHVPDIIVIGASLGDARVVETTELLSTCPATAHIPILRLAAGGRLPSRL